MDINEVTLLGRAGQDPEVRYTQSGAAVLSFSMATSKKWKDKNSGQLQEKTTWHHIVLWGRAVDWVKDNLRKGDQVLVKGAYESRQWEDKQGQKRTQFEVIATQVHTFNRREASQNHQPAGDSGFGQPGPEFTEDDIPF